MYRVPVSNVSEVDDELHQELLVEENSDIDSDVASDIAEEVISRLIAKERVSKQVELQTTAVEHLSTVCTPAKSSETAVKDAFRRVVSTEPDDSQPPKQEMRRPKPPKVRKRDIIEVCFHDSSSIV
ncbi:unnamed protein product [Dicrocoelium dendriticum]|nr:unnamed protein product [Dicrocoelium dendriticum]CAI2737082.1 unnamed protein product [Dicrocoelium dendriticum]